MGRRWHRPINQKQRRYAVCSALAASAIPALLMARGHKVDSIPEVPVVCTNAIESLTKTKAAVSLLKRLNAYEDVEKCQNSKKIRAGKGKMRNRRYTMRRGPLVIYNEDHGIKQAFQKLDLVYGTLRKPSTMKTNFKLPRAKMTNADLPRLIQFWLKNNKTLLQFAQRLNTSIQN